jgi:hypothetical protein
MPYKVITNPPDGWFHLKSGEIINKGDMVLKYKENESKLESYLPTSYGGYNRRVCDHLGTECAYIRKLPEGDEVAAPVKLKTFNPETGIWS